MAILNRLRACRAWLGSLVVALLRQRGIDFQAHRQVRLRILDATVITQPGSTGTDWRVHLSIDLERMSLDQVVITDAHGGEGFERFSLGPQDIGLADSGHAHPRSLAQPLRQGARLVVRHQWNTLPVSDQTGQKFAILAWLKHTFTQGCPTPAKPPVWFAMADGLQPLRLVACPLPADKAEQARARARKKSRKKRQPDPNNLFAAVFVLLLTNLCPDHWSAAQVLELYGRRWQIELYIKRLKSLLAIDCLRTQDPELAQTYLLSKLLAAMLVEAFRAMPEGASARFICPRRIAAQCLAPGSVLDRPAGHLGDG